MELVIGRGKQDRERGSFPPWEQENMLLEETKTDPKGYNLLSRPPLASLHTWGSGPIHGIISKPGLFGGSLFAVVGGNLYKDGVSLGAVNGTGPVSWAAGIGELVVTRGQTAYSYNGTTLAAIAFPDSANVRAVSYMARRFIFVRSGSGRFYWSEVDDGRTIDGLNFATAESEQDELYDLKRMGDLLLLMGANTIESWILTGDDLLPWSKVSQRTFKRGVQDTGCAEEIEGTVYFIASDGMVCRITETAERVSTAALDEKIRKSTTGSTYWFQYEGKPILVLRLDAGTYGLDLALDHQTVSFSTVGRDQWAPKCACNIGSEPVFGDDTDGNIWYFDPTSTTDSGQATYQRTFTAGLPLGAPQSIFRVVVEGNAGDTPDESGAASVPILEMSYSRDGGREWGDWRGAEWGRQGQYRRRARYGSCGQFKPPGFLARFRMLECMPNLRIARVAANESLAGRGW